MRLHNEPLPVQTNDQHEPTSFIWKQQRYFVSEIQETWLWAGKWWWTGKTQRRRYFRVTAAPARGTGRTFEIYVENTGQWVMSRLAD